MGGFTLAYAANPVISLVSNLQERRQGPAESRWVALAPLDELASEPCLLKAMPPLVLIKACFAWITFDKPYYFF